MPPVTAANIRFQDYQFDVQTPTGTWRWTTRMDVSGSIPSFLVRDIQSPWGLFRDTIPIPGDVVQAMSSSIDQIRLNFPPKILIGPPVSLLFEVDEGRGFSAPQAVVLTNDGVFGSLLGTSITTSAPYVSTAPANVGNLATNESGSFSVSVDSTDLLAVAGPYNEQVVVQDPNATNTPQTLPVTINVRPKAVILASPLVLNFTVSKPFTGPYPVIPSQQVTLQNTGPLGSVLAYQIQRLTALSSDWLVSFAPSIGSLGSGGSQTITVAVAPIEGLSVGTYQETLRISGYSTNSFVDVLIQLVIT